MQTPKKNFLIAHHNVTRCGELLNNMQFRTFFVLLSWYDYEEEKGSVYYRTLAEGQKNQTKLDYVDRGCGIKKDWMQRCVKNLAKTGAISIIKKGGENGREMMEFKINWDFFSQMEPMVGRSRTYGREQSDTYGSEKQIPMVGRSQDTMVGRSQEGRPKPTTEKKPKEETSLEEPEEETTHRTTMRDEIESEAAVDKKDMNIQHSIKETPMMNLKPTQHDKDLSTVLNTGLSKQGYKHHDLSMLICYWRSKFGINLKKEHVNLILNEVRIHPVESSLVLFKKVKTISEKTMPKWKQMLEERKGSLSEAESLSLPLKIIDKWFEVGLNGINPADSQRIARQIQPAISDLRKDHADLLTEIIEPAFKNRVKADYSPASDVCKSFTWLFKYQELDGNRLYNVEKLALGQLNGWKTKDSVPAIRLANYESDDLEDLQPLPGSKITL